MPPLDKTSGQAQPGQDEERPVSIASLRSKFENLASESKGLREPIRGSTAVKSPVGVAGKVDKDIAGGSGAGAGAREDGNSRIGNGEAVSAKVETLTPTTLTARPTSPAMRRKPVPLDVEPSGTVSNNQGSSTPLIKAATSPIPSLRTYGPADPGPSSHPSSPPDEPTAAPSVSALRARFGGSSVNSGLVSRDPSPARGATPTYKQQPSPSPAELLVSETKTPAEVERAIFVDEPEVEEAMARRGSAISINEVDTNGTSKAIPISPPGRTPPVRRPSGPRKQSSSSSASKSPIARSPAAASVMEAARPVVSQPAPIARRPSPAPPISSKPQFTLDSSAQLDASTAVPSIARRPSPAPPSNAEDTPVKGPPPPPPSRSGAGPTSQSTSSSSAKSSSPPISAATQSSAPPSLPARKPSLPPSGPPPVPLNRPAFPSGATEPIVPTQAPPLPTRPRGETVTQQPLTALPPLPSRSGTAPATLPPPPTRSQASYVARQTSVRRPVRQDSHGLTPSLPPRDIAQSSPSSRQRSGTLISPNDGYQPPPPPSRTINPGDSISAIPPSRQDSRGMELDSEDEDDPEEAAQAPVLTSTAKRLLEEYPDSTTANRRPPRFVPDIKISGTSHLSAFAVHGRHVCTGTTSVKVYDTLMSDQPILSVDLRETGLDFRVKENRVTAMCFRPAVYESEEGRYLWCGTKDGHLWELDIKTGQITDTRAFAHSSAVAHIFRYKRFIMSLEEGGKLHVFKVGERDARGALEDVKHIPVLCKTIRVQERFNFAKLICGRLWTSSGPVNRSTTNAASKGPTIRVYEPCGASTTLSGGKTAWTSEWTGAVTSATILPLQPNTVFMGHEGGFVSVWDAEELVCIQVLKISPNDIMALEGVGERLWAGSRKGMISVYDVSEKPWRTTNTWIAHPEHPLSELVVDPYSVQDSGRFVLWSLARDALRAWDGLLSVDWVDQHMYTRQPDYCAFRSVKTLICSWNIDSAKPGDLSGTEDNVHFFPDLLGSVDQPEIIVFGFQEVIPLTDKKLTAKTLLFGGKSKESNATADKISHAYRQWLDKLQTAVHSAYPGTQYVKVHSESLVGLFTCVFVKADERDLLRDVEVCTVKRGIGGIYGNKGAIIARLVIDDTSLCFINVHLAAGQSAKSARTADLAAIMEDKAVFPASDALPYIRGGDGTAISDHELVFLNGDLNYRIDQRRENVLASVAAGDLQYLLEHDQLRKEMRSNHAFRLRSFEEAPIAFKPTYKYNRGEVEYDSSEKKRIPAWCDRILYSKSPRIECLHYDRYEPTVSDHRPVSAGFKLHIKAIDWERMKVVREEVRKEWAKREADLMGKIEGAYVDLL